MRFKVDENLPDEAAEHLMCAGHDATTVVGEGVRGCSDSALALRCKDESRVLVTLDLDFADLKTYPPSAYPGSVVLRLARQDKTLILFGAATRVALPRAGTDIGSPVHCRGGADEDSGRAATAGRPGAGMSLARVAASG
jgi:hypothetical protein